jgi:hypothetical protein
MAPDQRLRYLMMKGKTYPKIAAIVAGAIPALTVNTPFQMSDVSARCLNIGTFSIACRVSGALWCDLQH